MNQRSGRSLVTSACAIFAVIATGAVAQDQSGECTPPVPGLTLVTITNEELSGLDGLLGFEVDVTTGCRLGSPNLLAAGILSRLDIDGDDVPDGSADVDGDGLPDNWELGGVETSALVEDRVVFFPAPSAIVPGTPPTPVFTRRAVATSALLADTDGDGLSDFIEVFGLMFIDDNRNGILDAGEWADFNGDGLPSPGEYPVDQSGAINDLLGEYTLIHDFDGFVFTDPTNPDTDGDGELDGKDRDPLVNPRAFGIADTIIVRFDAKGNPDIDQDGLGNGMDMGNDLLPDEAPDLPSFQVIDNPQNLRDLLDLFREDLLAEGVVPESAIEDLVGADWDGNGLWRTTDVRNWSLIIDPADEATRPPDEFFQLDDGTVLYSAQKLAEEDLTQAEVDAGRRSLMAIYNDRDFDDDYGGRGVGLGWQKVLRPSSTDQFIPDKRVWAILYAWRMPGFDIDGDGFVGVPNLTATTASPAETPEGEVDMAMVALRPDSTTGRLLLTDQVPLLDPESGDRPFDDRIPIGEPEPQDPSLNGVIEVGNLRRALGNLGCGATGIGMLGVIGLALLLPMWWRRR